MQYGKLRAHGLPGSANRSKRSRPENFSVAPYQLSSEMFGGDERRHAISMRPSFDAEHEDARAFRMDTFSFAVNRISHQGWRRGRSTGARKADVRAPVRETLCGWWINGEPDRRPSKRRLRQAERRPSVG